MAALISSAIASLDGYIADEQGAFDWAAPDEEVHTYVNALERPIGTYLYGRRMYETMVFWETEGDGDDEPAPMHEYAEIWRAADKVVFSRTLAAGIVDQLHLFVVPVVIGGGTRALPDGVRLGLELVADHRFGSGVVHLHYRMQPPAAG
jgi:dihydrofolate reductase